VGRDVFAVLASNLGSPSLNRALKANVASKIAKGAGVKMELMVQAQVPAWWW
jgi:hypothetical protein